MRVAEVDEHHDADDGVGAKVDMVVGLVEAFRGYFWERVPLESMSAALSRRSAREAG